MTEKLVRGRCKEKFMVKSKIDIQIKESKDYVIDIQIIKEFKSFCWNQRIKYLKNQTLRKLIKELKSKGSTSLKSSDQIIRESWECSGS